jgi:hypothetical protein
MELMLFPVSLSKDKFCKFFGRMELSETAKKCRQESTIIAAIEPWRMFADLINYIF